MPNTKQTLLTLIAIALCVQPLCAIENHANPSAPEYVSSTPSINQTSVSSGISDDTPYSYQNFKKPTACDTVYLAALPSRI